jgi:hypothetical protein
MNLATAMKILVSFIFTAILLGVCAAILNHKQDHKQSHKLTQVWKDLQLKAYVLRIVLCLGEIAYLLKIGQS